MMNLTDQEHIDLHQLDGIFQSQRLRSLEDFVRAHPHETNVFDYKRQANHLREVAKDILAMANYGRGYIILGIDDDKHGGAIVGEEKKRDMSQLSGLEGFIPHVLRSSLSLSSIPMSKSDQAERYVNIIRVVGESKYRPYISTGGYDSKDHDLTIQKREIYVRRLTKSERADHDEIRDIVRSATRKERSIYQHFVTLDRLMTIAHDLERRVAVPTHLIPGVGTTVNPDTSIMRAKRLEIIIANLIALQEQVMYDEIDPDRLYREDLIKTANML